VGSYRLVRRIGEGGMSTVWLGEHPVIGARVAVKLLRSDLMRHPRAIGRFFNESRMVNRIDSCHIVKLFDFNRLLDGRHYAVMELLEGRTLADWLWTRGPFAWSAGRAVAAQLALAVLAVHQAGIIHRDVKPENVFLLDDEEASLLVKLFDFGLARPVESEPRVGLDATLPGTVMGTPVYAAPEQLAGRPVAPSADIYAMGSVLYHMLGGQPPFLGSVDELIQAKVEERRIPPRLRLEGLPEEAAELIERMLDPRPAARPVAAEVWEQLRGPAVARPEPDAVARFLEHELVGSERRPRPATVSTVSEPGRRGSQPSLPGL